MDQAARQKLADLDRELRSNLASPRPDTVRFLRGALDSLREIPFAIEPAQRVACLLSIAQQFYHQGQETFSAVEPAALAVMVASDLDDASLYRKALTFKASSSLKRTILVMRSYRCVKRFV